jgi:hypothetical protein
MGSKLLKVLRDDSIVKNCKQRQQFTQNDVSSSVLSRGIRRVCRVAIFIVVAVGDCDAIGLIDPVAQVECAATLTAERPKRRRGPGRSLLFARWTFQEHRDVGVAHRRFVRQALLTGRGELAHSSA